MLASSQFLKVRWINACWILALMMDFHAFFNFAIGQMVRNNMR